MRSTTRQLDERVRRQLDERFQRLLDDRRRALPDVDRQLTTLQAAASAVTALDQAVTELGGARTIPAELVDRLRAVDLTSLHGQVEQTVGVLRLLRVRLGRETINIGVGGPARVGKSTLLQSISGLSDDQIPTADGGLPVTAVRSRIYHADGLAEARLAMHTFESFRLEVLEPFHKLLELPEVPATLAGYRATTYPRHVDELPRRIREETKGATSALHRLRQCQASLPSYEAFLTGGERVEALDGLRSWVAYPSDGDSVVRPYLAIRDVRIMCPFPRAAVRSLGVVDLPGLGEVLPDAEKRHMRGLQDDADFVLLMLRPGSVAFWEDKAESARFLIGEARGPVKNLRDFAGILVNSGSIDDTQRGSLRQAILTEVNEGVPDKNMCVYETDAVDPERVHTDVLVPVLDHLAESLPEMDRQHATEAMAQVRLLHDRARHDLAVLERAIQEWAVSAPNTTERFEESVTALRAGLAGQLRQLIGRYRVSSAEGAVDDAFLASVEESYTRLLDWAGGGFGRGREEWKAAATQEAVTEGNAAAFATRELNAVRNHIAEEFGDLDAICQGHVAKVHNEVAAVLGASFGELLAENPGQEGGGTAAGATTAPAAGPGASRAGAEASGGNGDGGEARLIELARLSADAFEPCEQIPSVLRRLVDLRLDYSTLILPRVRRQLDVLDAQRLLESGELTIADVEDLLVTLRQLTEQAAWEVKKALLAESVTPHLAVLVALEQFEDAFIRSAGADRELRRLARSYRDEIWPDTFRGPNAASGRLTAVRRSLKDVIDELAVAAGAERK